MKFMEMIRKLDDETSAFRISWTEGKLMWKHGNVLVHNTPYWSGDTVNQFLNGYVYVSETEDIEADDWVLTKAQRCPATK